LFPAIHTELQNSDVAGSGLDWVLVQPVHLTDGSEDVMPFTSTAGEIAQNKVTRNSVGRLLAQARAHTRSDRGKLADAAHAVGRARSARRSALTTATVSFGMAKLRHSGFCAD
jgi:hypothetical protein